MKRINFEFPVLVRQNQKGLYVLRPLFRPFVKSENRRFKKAQDTLAGRLRNEFRNTNIDPDTITDLLWLKFNPLPVLSKTFLSFTSGRDIIHQNFTFSSFKLNNDLILHFPDFGDYMCIARKNNTAHPEVQDQILEIIQSQIRNLRKINADKFDVKKLESRKSEFIITTNFHTQVSNEKIFGSEETLRERIFESVEFNGMAEIYKVGYSLNELYPNNLLQAWYREDVVLKIHNILFNPKAAVLALIGPEGSGKTTAIHSALRKYLKQQHKFDDAEVREIFFLDPNRIIAGMSIVGYWQKRVEAILEDIIKKQYEDDKIAPDFIYFDNPVALFRIGKSSQNNMTISDMLKPYIEKRKIPFILEATPDEWKLIQEIDRRFADLFQVVRIDEASPETALDITLKNRIKLETDFDIKLNNDALMKLFSIQRLYMHRHALPGSIVKYMEQLATKYKSDVSEKDIIEDFSERSTLRKDIFNHKIINKDEIAGELKKRLIGQNDAITAMSDIIHLINANLNDPAKPMASLLFAGPTGVGKTQAAKVMANYLFESEENMIRFDMNEYIDAGAVSRLIGDFYNPEGQLTGRIRYNPYCVLLLDEIEKAHPDVHDLLLQVLGEGRLTDSSGHTVDFTNTIIIMTSNLGADTAGHEMGYVTGQAAIASNFNKAIENFFRPEMINRIDEIVIFKKLTMDEIMQIAGILIKELLNRDGFVRRSTLLQLQPEALKMIAENGYNPDMGARSLKRKIEKEVIETAAEHLIDTNAAYPIIFQLFLIQNKLVHRITKMRNIPPAKIRPLPVYQNLREEEEALERMLETLEKVEEEVIIFRESQSENTGDVILDSDDLDLILLTEEIRTLQSEIRTILHDMSVARQRKVNYVKNLNRQTLASRQTYRIDATRLGELFQQSANQNFPDSLASEGEITTIESDDYVTEYFTRLSYINYFWNGYQNDEFDYVLVHIQPLVEQESAMIDNYGLPFFHLWKSWPFLEKAASSTRFCSPDEEIPNGELYLYFSGPGLFELLKQEEGIHLFAINSRMHPASVKVQLLSADDYYDGAFPEPSNHKKKLPTNAQFENTDEIPEINPEIIRIYVQDTVNSKNDLIADLRTGIIHKTKTLTPTEAEVLLLFNMPDKYKPF